MLNYIEPLLDIPTVYYGALLGFGFCVYYLFEVVKVSKHGGQMWVRRHATFFPAVAGIGHPTVPKISPSMGYI